MKKAFLHFVFCALFLSAASFSQAQTALASFEGSADLFNTLGGATLSIVTNPSTTGLNSSANCLRWVSANGNWWEGTAIYNSDNTPVTIDANNRYCHVFVYAQTENGTDMSVKKGQIHFSDATGTDWGTDSYNYDVSFTVNQWTDVVIDLNGFPSGLYGIHFRGHWDNQEAGLTFYYDEIVLNNSPATRNTVVINSASVLGDFEDGGVVPGYAVSGGALSSLNIANNPYPNILNGTDKVLSGTTATSGAQWWGGAEVTLGNKNVLVNDATRYLHILVYTDLPELELVVYSSAGEKWAGKQTLTSSGVWFDFVQDLYAVDEANLNGAAVSGFRFAFDASQEAAQNKMILIDEIRVDADLNPRTGTQTGLNEQEVEQPVAVRYYTLQGIEVKQPVKGNVYLVRKIYESQKSETIKILYR